MPCGPPSPPCSIPISRLRIIPMELGGGFGAKLRLCLEPYPVFLALKTGKPVKMVATREEVFTLSGFRLPTTVYLKTGVIKDGTIVAREAISIFDMGAYLGAGVQSGVSHTVGPYNIPNHRVRSYAVYTNKIWAGSYRASGVADVTFAVESHTDIIARQLGMDPWDFRMQNILKEGDVAIQGGRLPRNGLRQTLEAVKERMSSSSKSGDGQGVGLAVCQWRSGSGPSTASISITEEGTVSLLTGSVDISGISGAVAPCRTSSLRVVRERKPARGFGGSSISTLACRSGRLARPTKYAAPVRWEGWSVDEQAECQGKRPRGPGMTCGP